MEEDRMGEQRRALLAALPAPAASVAQQLEQEQDAWWVAAAAVAAVRAAGDAWTADEAAHVLATGTARTAAFDGEVQTVLENGSLKEWLQGQDRWPRLLLRRRLWHMQWLLRIPLARGSTAHVAGDLAALAELPLLEHAHNVCLAGNAVALRALLGAHVGIARALFPYRFLLLHALLTAGGVGADELLELRLLPGTKLPVEDCESGAWIELATKAMSPAAAAALWVEHPHVLELLAERGYEPPPAAPPAPPAGLSEWYLDVVHELEARLGLVAQARALAEAGVRLSLVPLRAVAHELRFLEMLLATLGAGARRWNAAALHAADASTLLQCVVQQPLPVPDVVRMLEEHVAPFLRKGTYASPGAFHMASQSDAGVLIVLAVLDLAARAISIDRALQIAAQIIASSWIEAAAQKERLALAILATCDASDDAAYVAMHTVSRVPSPTERVPLVEVLGASRDTSPRTLYERLCVASPGEVHAALGAAAQCVDLGQVLLRDALTHAPRFYLALDEKRTKALCASLVRTARGSDAALVRLVDDIAPYVAGPSERAPLPSETPRWVLTQLLAHREFAQFHALAAHIVRHPRLGVCLGEEDATALVLDAARTWIEQATTCDPLHAPLQRASECLTVAPHMPEADEERAFLAMLSQLARYPIPSLANATQPLTPRELRAIDDKLLVLGRILALHSSAYRAPQIRTLARALTPGVPPKVAEVRIDAMLADAAAANGDFAAARDLCDRTAKAAKTLPRDTAHDAAHDAAWRACFQLAKHPEWHDERARALVFGQAMALAPPAQLPRLLDAWRARGAHSGVPPAPSQRPQRTLARFLGAPTRPEAPDPSARATRSLFDHLGQDAPSTLLPSTTSLRDVVNTSFTRGMGWWMGESEHEAR